MSKYTFAGQPLVEGDILDDIVDGPVMVIELTETNIIGRMMGNQQRRVAYSFSGVQARRKRRTLWWHFPVTDEPLKNPVHWGLQQEFAKSTSTAFRRYLKSDSFVAPPLSVVGE